MRDRDGATVGRARSPGCGHRGKRASRHSALARKADDGAFPLLNRGAAALVAPHVPGATALPGIGPAPPTVLPPGVGTQPPGTSAGWPSD